MWQIVYVVISQANQAHSELFSEAVLVLDKGDIRISCWTPGALTALINRLCLSLRAIDWRVQTKHSQHY